MGKRIIIYAVMQHAGRTFIIMPPAFERAVARAVAALACSLAFATAGHAQGFPVRPILLVLPTAPGGPVDIVARIVAPEASKLLGQPIVMENRSEERRVGNEGRS